jgi:uncharacterized integral membrane protein
MSPSLALGFCILGCFVALGGGAWLVFEGFKKGILWAVLAAIPATAPVFLYKHWKEARFPFFIALFGLLLSGSMFVVSPNFMRKYFDEKQIQVPKRR